MFGVGSNNNKKKRSVELVHCLGNGCCWSDITNFTEIRPTSGCFLRGLNFFKYIVNPVYVIILDSCCPIRISNVCRASRR